MEARPKGADPPGLVGPGLCLVRDERRDRDVVVGAGRRVRGERLGQKEPVVCGPEDRLRVQAASRARSAPRRPSPSSAARARCSRRRTTRGGSSGPRGGDTRTRPSLASSCVLLCRPTLAVERRRRVGGAVAAEKSAWRNRSVAPQDTVRCGAVRPRNRRAAVRQRSDRRGQDRDAVAGDGCDGRATARVKVTPSPPRGRGPSRARARSAPGAVR